MTLEEYFKSLTDFVNEHPEFMKLPVIYAKDDAGNGFRDLIVNPGTLMKKNKYDSVGWTTEFQLEQEADAVCIN